MDSDNDMSWYTPEVKQNVINWLDEEFQVVMNNSRGYVQEWEHRIFQNARNRDQYYEYVTGLIRVAREILQLLYTQYEIRGPQGKEYVIPDEFWYHGSILESSNPESSLNMRISSMMSRLSRQLIPCGPIICGVEYTDPSSSSTSPNTFAYYTQLTPIPRYMYADQEQLSYDEKIREMRQYIEPLRRMLMGNDDPEQFVKMRRLLEVLSTPDVRISIDTLKKCEDVLERMNIMGKFNDLPPVEGVNMVEENADANQTFYPTFEPDTTAPQEEQLGNLPEPDELSSDTPDVSSSNTSDVSSSDSPDVSSSDTPDEPSSDTPDVSSSNIPDVSSSDTPDVSSSDTPDVLQGETARDDQ